MKHTIAFSLTSLLLFLGSCSLFEYDNYEGPNETFRGKVVDKETKEAFQVEARGGTRIKMLEMSWSDNATPHYFNVMQDGTFNNTKVFKGDFDITIEGPFVPYIQYDEKGNVIVDHTVRLDIKGNTEHTFEVEPFLKVEWVGEPIVNAADSSITVSVRITRGTSNPLFQQNVTDVFLYVSQVPYVANNEYDGRYSQQIKYEGGDFNERIGKPLTFKTKGLIYGKRDWFIRVGARIDYISAGSQRYNYSTVKTVNIPF